MRIYRCTENKNSITANFGGDLQGFWGPGFGDKLQNIQSFLEVSYGDWLKLE